MKIQNGTFILFPPPPQFEVLIYEILEVWIFILHIFNENGAKIIAYLGKNRLIMHNVDCIMPYFPSNLRLHLYERQLLKIINDIEM